MADKKPGPKAALTDEEEASVVVYILRCAVLGCALTRAAADLKIKRIVEARGGRWETADGLYARFLTPPPPFSTPRPCKGTFITLFNRPSNGWWDNFLLKHDEVRLKIAKKIDRIHAFAANPNDVKEFFKILEELFEYFVSFDFASSCFCS